MALSDWIGFIGVTILLLAFLLNLIGKMTQNDLIYIILNILGAGLAGFASVLIHYVPFIILEGAWTLVSIYGLINYFVQKNKV
jgi:hypothetical protein